MTKEKKQIFKEAGLKTTHARNSILEIFSKDCMPIDARSIHEKLKSQKINLVTIYRTLGSLEKSGILKKVDIQKGSAHYELKANHHHHIICLDCGKIEGFQKCDIGQVSKDVLKKSSSFKSIDEHSLELFGMCKSCFKV